MAARRAPLPTTVAEWRTVIQRALSLPKNEIRLPQHYVVRERSPPHKPVSFGIHRLPENTVKQFSGVMLLLMPQQLISSPPSVASATGPTPTWLDLAVPLTKRNAKLRAHSGEMALPGGRCDAGERPDQAAQRECLEEIGVPAFVYDVLGSTSRVYSYPSKSYVEPTIGLAKEDLSKHISVASPDEVASIHYLTLSELLFNRGGKCHTEIVKQFSGSSLGEVLMPAFDTSDGQRVWGLTAFVLCEFSARLATVLNVVAPYESPFVPNSVGSNGEDQVAYHNPYDAASRQPDYDDSFRKVDAKRVVAEGPIPGEEATTTGSGSSKL